MFVAAAAGATMANVAKRICRRCRGGLNNHHCFRLERRHCPQCTRVYSGTFAAIVILRVLRVLGGGIRPQYGSVKSTYKEQTPDGIGLLGGALLKPPS
jgi:hypothetical protein